MVGSLINMMMCLVRKVHPSMIRFSKRLMIGTIHTAHSSNTYIECLISTTELWTMLSTDRTDMPKNGHRPRKDSDKIYLIEFMNICSVNKVDYIIVVSLVALTLSFRVILHLDLLKFGFFTQQIF